MLIRVKEAVAVVEALTDPTERRVLRDAIERVSKYHDTKPTRWPTSIDLFFIALILTHVLQDRAVNDILSGDIHKHDWFENESGGGVDQSPREGPWGLRHSDALAYIDSFPDAMLSQVLSFLLAKAIMLQIFEKQLPAVKLDLLFLVESVGQTLSLHPELMNDWRSLASPDGKREELILRENEG